jgi:hypothetical protein
VILWTGWKCGRARMSRRRNVNQIFDPVLIVNISATNVKRLVYLLVANRPVRYGKEYSRIVT